METKWLAIQSFQKNQQLVSAINTLSMHLKLKTLGLEEHESEEVKESKKKIELFLSDFDKIILEYEQNRFQAIPGVSPRLRELASQFSKVRKNKFKKFKNSNKLIVEIKSLLKSKKNQNVTLLLSALHEFRLLLSENTQIASKNIIPEF